MEKEAQYMINNPVYVANQIKEIINIMIGRMSMEAQMRARPNIKSKLFELNSAEISNKKSPGGASIGVSISLVKNILNGRDPVFINAVLRELGKVL